MHDTTIAAKLLGQLESFLGRISPHFHKPVARFIGDMVYGIMVEKDVKLSSVVRALKEKTTPKKVEDRLSRMLSADGLEAGLHRVIASEGAKRVHKDTLIILDPSDVQKPYAKKMEYLAKVWDGSKGEVGDNLGFWGCMAVACESGGRRPIPLHFRLWSAGFSYPAIPVRVGAGATSLSMPPSPSQPLSLSAFRFGCSPADGSLAVFQAASSYRLPSSPAPFFSRRVARTRLRRYWSATISSEMERLDCERPSTENEAGEAAAARAASPTPCTAWVLLSVLFWSVVCISA